MDVPLEAAGFASVAGLDVVAWCSYFLLCGALAVAVGLVVTTAPLKPHTARRNGHRCPSSIF